MKYALENPCILFISVFRKLLPQSLQKQLKSTPNCETSKLHLGSHMFLIEFFVSCFVVCEQGQETLEPQQHSEAKSKA
jgi:hypothetical protein